MYEAASNAVQAMTYQCEAKNITSIVSIYIQESDDQFRILSFSSWRSFIPCSLVQDLAWAITLRTVLFQEATACFVSIISPLLAKALSLQSSKHLPSCLIGHIELL